MDFTKFVAMLESQALYFARADRLGDPFEGSYSRANERMRFTVYADIPEEARQTFSTHMAEMARQMRNATFVNCWHLNESESAGMWRLYAQTNEAVAIKSRFYKLANALDESVYVGTVAYIDFRDDWLPEGNTFYPYLHKRKSFAHEAEVRAICLQIPTRNGVQDFSAPPADVGLSKQVALDQLIEDVYVAPTCSPWFKDLVRRVCDRYSLKRQVYQSSLDDEPFF